MSTKGSIPAEGRTGIALSNNTALILNDPEIRKYFLNILQSNLSDEDKYARFIGFFELENRIKSELRDAYSEQLLTIDTDKIDELVSAASQTIGIWKPEGILQQTRDSIMRALQRLKHSQHRDGGWGFQVEVSGSWGTAYAVLCLNAAERMGEFNLSLDENLRRGSQWFKEHPDEWSVENIELLGSRSVYDVSIVIRACYETEDIGFESLDRSLHRLWESQNQDGGWDARIWPANYLGPCRSFSDVGATSTALHALATVKRSGPPGDLLPDLDETFFKGLQWFINTQNDDGSWNNKSCTPTSRWVEGDPSITKTCDGMKGILIASRSLPTLDAKAVAASGRAVDKAVDWLLSKERALYDWSGNIVGWGWEAEMIGDQQIADLETTWLTLETLVQIDSESISLPLLTANAQWLMKQQHRPATNGDVIEDGKWEPTGHTARIALSLIEFYKKIKGSPLFEITSEHQSQTATQVNEG